MRNITLAQAVIHTAETDPEHFSMRNWGLPGPDGPVACLAGWTLLHSGWILTSPNTFLRPFSRRTEEDVCARAKVLLGLTEKEWRTGYHWWKCNLFCENTPDDHAVRIFRTLVTGTGNDQAVRQLSLLKLAA
jgi:hypothetical protein